MKRALGVALLVVLIAAGLLWPVLAQAGAASETASYDPVTITNYRADMVVAADGLLTAKETITAHFPVARHGLFRFWDVKDAADAHNRYIPTISSITMDGAAVPWELQTQGAERYVVAKIGDPDRYLSTGDHVYVIQYTVPGAIAPGSAGVGRYVTSEGEVSATAPSAFYWNVVAPGWRNDINRAEIHLTLPSPALGVQCSAGVSSGLASGQGPCTVEGVGTSSVTLTAQDIPAESGMTARVPMAMPAPARMSLPWPVLFDKVLGRTVWPVLLAGLLTLLGLALGIAWSSSTREQEPGLPVMYAPPAGFGPVETVYVVQEDTGHKALLATVLYLADRGLVSLDHRSDDSWLVTNTGTDAQWMSAGLAARGVGSALGVLQQPGMWFLADGSKGAGEKLLDAQKTIEQQVASWAKDEGYVTQDRTASMGCMVWVVALVLAVVGFIGWRWPTMWGLPAAAFALGGIALANPKAMTRRTETGRRAWSEAGGFRRMLSTPSSEERFDFAARKDLFIPYIPYAVAFGVADKWAEKYRVEMHEEPPIPLWYPMAYGYGASSLYSGGGFDSFDSSVSSAIGAYQASQSSSSGGGGGGGFGGGGGGGGGGSW